MVILLQAFDYWLLPINLGYLFSHDGDNLVKLSAERARKSDTALLFQGEAKRRHRRQWRSAGQWVCLCGSLRSGIVDVRDGNCGGSRAGCDVHVGGNVCVQPDFRSSSARQSRQSRHRRNFRFAQRKYFMPSSSNSNPKESLLS